MTGPSAPEDHRDAEPIPAAVTCAFGRRDVGGPYCDGSCGTRLEHSFRVIREVGRMMFEHQAGDGPFTCDDDGKPIT